jgi:hypothetical protein
MHTDFSNASAPKNLLMHKEGDQAHITNDAETVRKLLKRESISKEPQERMAKIEVIGKELKDSNKEPEHDQKVLKESNEGLEGLCKELSSKHTSESWSTHEFEDIEVRQLLQKHSLLITNGVARDFLERFKAFKRAMGAARLSKTHAY